MLAVLLLVVSPAACLFLEDRRETFPLTPHPRGASPGCSARPRTRWWSSTRPTSARKAANRKNHISSKVPVVVRAEHEHDARVRARRVASVNGEILELCL